MEKVSELEKKLIQTTKEMELLKVMTWTRRPAELQIPAQTLRETLGLMLGVCRRVFVNPAVR